MGGGSQFAGLKGSKSLGWRRQEGDWCEDQEAAPTPHLISECKHEFVLPMSALWRCCQIAFSVCFLHSVSTPTLRYLIPAFTEQTSAWSLMLALNLQCAAWSSYFLYWRPLTLQLLLPSATANPSLLVDIKRISTSAGNFPQNPPDLKPYLTMMD